MIKHYRVTVELDITLDSSCDDVPDTVDVDEDALKDAIACAITGEDVYLDAPDTEDEDGTEYALTYAVDVWNFTSVRDMDGSNAELVEGLQAMGHTEARAQAIVDEVATARPASIEVGDHNRRTVNELYGLR